MLVYGKVSPSFSSLFFIFLDVQPHLVTWPIFHRFSWRYHQPDPVPMDVTSWWTIHRPFKTGLTGIGTAVALSMALAQNWQTSKSEPAICAHPSDFGDRSPYSKKKFWIITLNPPPKLLWNWQNWGSSSQIGLESNNIFKTTSGDIQGYVPAINPNEYVYYYIAYLSTYL